MAFQPGSLSFPAGYSIEHLPPVPNSPLPPGFHTPIEQRPNISPRVHAQMATIAATHPAQASQHGHMHGPNIPQADFIAPADNRAIGDTLARLNAQMTELRQQLHNQNVAASQRDQMVSNLAQAFSTLTTSSSGRPNPSTTAARTTDSVPMSGPANNDNNYHGSNSGGKPSKPAPFHGHSGDAHGKTSSNVHTFLFQLEEYFALTREHDDIMRIMIAGTLLRDSAATWYRAVRDPAVTPADRIIRTWSDFCTKLRENFTTVNEVQAARDQLYKLKHGGNVRLFIQQFRTLCMQIPNISHEEKLHMFIKKLPHEIKMFIVTHPYEHDFESAVTMAERLDMNMSYYRTDSKTLASSSSPAPASSGPVPMDLNAMRTGRGRSFSKGRSPSRHRSPSKHAGPSTGHLPPPPDNRYRVDAARAKELKQKHAEDGDENCWYCHEPGHWSVDCPKKKAKGSRGDRDGSAKRRRAVN